MVKSEEPSAETRDEFEEAVRQIQVIADIGSPSEDGAVNIDSPAIRIANEIIAMVESSGGSVSSPEELELFMAQFDALDAACRG